MDIKVLGICGSPVVGGNTEKFLEVAFEAAREIPSVETELVRLAKKDIKSCIHCNWCVRKQEAGKFCSINDDMAELYPKLLEADVIFFATPVYFARLSGHLACVLDRIRALFEGKMYRNSMKHKVGSAFAVSWLRNSGLEFTLQSLNASIVHMNMILVTGGYLSTFGGAGVSSLGGTGAREQNDRLLVLRDEFGVNTAKATAKNAVEVAMIIKNGRQAMQVSQEGGLEK